MGDRSNILWVSNWEDHWRGKINERNIPWNLKPWCSISWFRQFTIKEVNRLVFEPESKTSTDMFWNTEIDVWVGEREHKNRKKNKYKNEQAVNKLPTDKDGIRMEEWANGEGC